MNTAAEIALENIRSQIAHQGKVSFAYHCWRDFNNLGSGLRFRSIPADTIPGYSLIPIVEYTDTYVDSRVNDNSPILHITPVSVPFKVSIEQSFTDLLTRYAKYGMVRVTPLDCSVDQAEVYQDVFNRMMEGFAGGVLQDLPEYFGAISPVRDMFGPDTKRVRTTAAAELDRLLNTQVLTREHYDKFKAAIPFFAESAMVAHRHALLPSSGKLTSSILDINSGERSNFDETDQYLIRQFPAFSADSRISKKNETDGITKLAELLADRLAAPVSQQAVTEAVAPAAAPSVEPEMDITENLDPTPPPFDPEKCKAISKATGLQCQRPPEANGYCNHFAHAALAETNETS